MPQLASVVFVVVLVVVVVGLVVVVIVVGHRNITLKFDQNWVNNELYIVVVIVLVLLLIQNTSFKT